MDWKDHNDAPVSEFAFPKKIQHIPYAEYPTPPPSLDKYTGDCLDENDGLHSEDYQPKGSLAWYKDGFDSYGTYCPKDKKFSCPTIKGKKDSSGDSSVTQQDYNIGNT